MNNYQWLLQMDGADRKAWFDAEHVETEERALDGDTVALEAEYGKGGLVGGSFIDIPEQGEVVMPLESWRDHLDTESESEDSREQLEVDIRKYANPEGNTGTLGACWERKMLEFIDRQAAITDRETKLRELYKFEENHREHIRSLEEVNRKLNERIAELQSQSDEKWNLYVGERTRADRLATDLGRCGVERETFRETTTVLMDSITDGLREVNAILDGKDEGLA